MAIGNLPCHSGNRRTALPEVHITRKIMVCGSCGKVMAVRAGVTVAGKIPDSLFCYGDKIVRVWIEISAWIYRQSVT
jgi:hypothetical protein